MRALETDSRITDRLRRFARRPHAVRNLVIRLALAIAAWRLAEFARHAKKPWETRWQERLDAGKVPGFQDYLVTGFWWGSVIVAILLVVLLASSFWWLRSPEPPVFQVAARAGAGTGSPRPSRRAFLVLLGLITLAAVPGRWIRMDFPLWGDEAGPILNYVHGGFVPADGEDLQGTMVFEPTDWVHVVFDDRRGGNNHYLLSILQRLSLDSWRALTGSDRSAFDERVIRLPAFVAGVALVGAVGLLGRRLGFPAAGLLAALVVAVHPWMIRFGSEARGYSLLLLFYVLSLICLVNVLEKGGWRWALAFAGCEFLALYSWKGLPVLFALTNGCAALVYLFAKPRTEGGEATPVTWHRRISGVGRLLVANLFAAAAFIILYLPCHAQILHFIERNNVVWGQSMDLQWLVAMIGTLLFGTPFVKRYVVMENEWTVFELWSAHPWVPWLAVVLLAGSFVFGAAILVRRAPRAALLFVPPLVTPVATFLQFKYLMGAGMLFFYASYVAPIVILATTLGTVGLGEQLAGRKGRSLLRLAPSAAILGISFLVSWPYLRYQSTTPVERLHEALALTRWRHEAPFQTAPSNVRTIWIGRRAWIYDGREIRDVDTFATLRPFIDEIRDSDGPVYVTVGNIGALEGQAPELAAYLADTSIFEPVAVLWADHPIFTLRVYRMRPATEQAEAPSPTGNP